jgi:hypothetical protein
LTQGDLAHIKAYFGSLKLWRNIGTWEDISASQPPNEPFSLDHGYDDKVPLTIDAIRDAALFRGGELLSRKYNTGDWRSPLDWCCHAGHEFTASLNLILKGGHWCPACIADTASYPNLARHSAFFNQVWEPDLALG